MHSLTVKQLISPIPKPDQHQKKPDMITHPTSQVLVTLAGLGILIFSGFIPILPGQSPNFSAWEILVPPVVLFTPYVLCMVLDDPPATPLQKLRELWEVVACFALCLWVVARLPGYILFVFRLMPIITVGVLVVVMLPRLMGRGAHTAVRRREVGDLVPHTTDLLIWGPW